MKPLILTISVLVVAVMAVACDEEDSRTEVEASPDQINAANSAVQDVGDLKMVPGRINGQIRVSLTTQWVSTATVAPRVVPWT